jgi:hypothetical protein
MRVALKDSFLADPMWLNKAREEGWTTLSACIAGITLLAVTKQ